MKQIRICCPVCHDRMRLTISAPPSTQHWPGPYARQRMYNCRNDDVWITVDLPVAVVEELRRPAATSGASPGNSRPR